MKAPSPFDKLMAGPRPSPRREGVGTEFFRIQLHEFSMGGAVCYNRDKLGGSRRLCCFLSRFALGALFRLPGFPLLWPGIELLSWRCWVFVEHCLQIFSRLGGRFVL